MKGKFIVLEGGEGSGKTTHAKELYKWLRSDAVDAILKANGYAGVELTREPGGTDSGCRIRKLLLEPPLPGCPPLGSKAELLLYAADRAQHVDELIRPWLEAGYWVVCDRYTDSTMAYQGYGRGLDLNLIHQINEVATNGLTTDLTLFMNVGPEFGLKRIADRGQADRMEQADMAFHNRVYQGFRNLACPTSGLEFTYRSGPTEVVDGLPSKPDVQAAIRKTLATFLLEALKSEL